MCTVLFYTILYYRIPYCTILYYYTVLYCAILNLVLLWRVAAGLEPQLTNAAVRNPGQTLGSGFPNRKSHIRHRQKDCQPTASHWPLPQTRAQLRISSSAFRGATTNDCRRHGTHWLTTTASTARATNERHVIGLALLQSPGMNVFGRAIFCPFLRCFRLRKLHTQLPRQKPHLLSSALLFPYLGNAFPPHQLGPSHHTHTVPPVPTVSCPFPVVPQVWNRLSGSEVLVWIGLVKCVFVFVVLPRSISPKEYTRLCCFLTRAVDILVLASFQPWFSTDLASTL